MNEEKTNIVANASQADHIQFLVRVHPPNPLLLHVQHAVATEELRARALALEHAHLGCNGHYLGE